MSKLIEKPKWYPLLVHKNKSTLSPEEWLYEIHKRVEFNHNLSFPDSFLHLLQPTAKADLFLEKISENNLDKFLLNQIYPAPGKPIKPLSISDAFRLTALIKKSDWYQTHPDKTIFESAIDTLTDGNELNQEQKIVFSKFYDIPWHTFHEKSQDKTWYPNKDITYLSGIPMSIDPGYAKADAATQLKNLLAHWVDGKLPNIELQLPHWKECNILAVFDLRMWFRLQCIKYTKIGLHKLLWPKGRFSKSQNECVDSQEDIKNIIALSEENINMSVAKTLLTLCDSRRNQKNRKSF